MYISLAQGVLKTGGLNHTNNPERASADRLPFYPLFLAGIFLLFGENLLAVAAVQILLDSLSCVFVYMLAEAVFKGAGLLSGVLAALNIGMITYAHFVLNDSLFIFGFLLLLLSIVKLLVEGRWQWSALTGIAAGSSALVRPVVIYLPFFIAPFLLVSMFKKHDMHWLIGAGKIMLIAMLFLIVLSPWAVRNFVHYGRCQMSTQSGEHLLQYIVPFVWQYSKGIPFVEGMKKTSDDFRQKASEVGLNPDKANPFEVSEFQAEMAMDYLRSEPRSAIVKAWVFGAVKNLFSPSIVDLSYLLKIERPHFFYTEGTTTLERAWNFVRGMKGWFGWAVILSIIGLVLSRFVELWGLVVLSRRKPWEAGLFLLIIMYFLLISGPVGYAKYRLPFEPILIILLAIGLKDLWERVKQRSEVGDQQRRLRSWQKMEQSAKRIGHGAGGREHSAWSVEHCARKVRR
jgi:4-amino-4-deoxy-L-arabinose transferase-like glycosyltransferase